MIFLANIGRVAMDRMRGLNYGAAVLLAVLIVPMHPRVWRSRFRAALSRQIVAGGVEAVGVVAFVAFLAGILIVVQVQLWLDKVAQSRLLGPVLVTVVIRELAPVMANFVCIARSGNAITAELANMKRAGQVRALELQGVDPLADLVVPRVLGVTISTFCLTLVFSSVCLAGGYFFARLINVHVGGLAAFSYSITRAIGRADLLNVIAKTAISPLVWGTICCIEGLGAGDAIADVTEATNRSVRRSIVSLFTIVTIVSVLTYA